MSKRGWLTVVAAAVAGCGTLIKPPDPDRRLDIRSAGTVFDADRGYKFVVLPEPNANVTRLDVRYQVGSIDDPVGKEGLAHLVEHLLTEVEVTRDGVKSSLDGEMGRIALSYNARTEYEATVYEATFLPAAIGDALQIESERLIVGCAGIPRDLFEREREVVRNEMRQRGAGSSELARGILEAVYPAGHLYRRYASLDSVAAINYEDVCMFLVGPYRRGLAIVTISGAVNVAMVQDAVSEHFGRVPKRSAAPLPAVSLAPVQGGTVKLKGAVDEPTLFITWPLPAMSTAEYRLLELAWPNVAPDLESYAFIFKWGHSASAQMLGGPRAPVLAVSIELNKAGDLDEAKSRLASALRDTFYEVARPGAEKKEAYWVRTWEGAVERLLARAETLAGRNEIYADFLQYEPQGSVVGRVQELQASTPLGVRGLAEKWLSRDRARFVFIEPSGAADVGAGGMFAGIVEQHGAHVDPALADQPLPVPKVSLRLAVERYTQDNGLSVILAPTSTDSPLAHARLVVDAGTADAPFGKEGIANVIGADEVYPDALVFDDRTLSNRVDDLIRSIASEIRIPGYGLSDERKNYLVARYSTQRVIEENEFELDLLVALYGEGHPYARNSISAAGIKHLSHDSVESWARGQVVPKNATLVVAGKFDPGLIKRHIAYHTDQISSGSHTKDVTTIARTTPGVVRGITSKPSSTVDIGVYFVGGDGIDRYHAQRLVLEAVIGGRLNELREKRALTYGIGAWYEPRRAGGMWSIHGQVDASRAAEASAGLVSILDEMRRDPETYRAAFVLARQKVLESLLVNVTSTSSLADRVADLARFGLPDDFYDQLVSAVAKLTLPELHAFLVRELKREKQVFGAFGNDSAVDDAVRGVRAVKPPEKPGAGTVKDPFQ